MYIAACDSGTQSVNARFGEVQSELKRYTYKFGILIITISESSQYAMMQDKVKNLAMQDTTGRMAVDKTNVNRYTGAEMCRYIDK